MAPSTTPAATTPAATLLLTAEQLGAMLGIAKQTVYNRLHCGADLPRVIYLGRLPRFPLTDVHAWINAKRAAAAPAAAPARHRPGRPTKTEQIARRTMGVA